jgi:hypothetical protein
MREGHTRLVARCRCCRWKLGYHLCARTMEFQLNEHHVGRPSGRMGVFRACSQVKEDAAARGLQEDVKLA